MANPASFSQCLISRMELEKRHDFLKTDLMCPRHHFCLSVPESLFLRLTCYTLCSSGPWLLLGLCELLDLFPGLLNDLKWFLFLWDPCDLQSLPQSSFIADGSDFLLLSSWLVICKDGLLLQHGCWWCLAGAS